MQLRKAKMMEQELGKLEAVIVRFDTEDQLINQNLDEDKAGMQAFEADKKQMNIDEMMFMEDIKADIALQMDK